MSGERDAHVDAQGGDRAMRDGFWNGLPTKVRHVYGTVRQHDPEKDPPQAWWAGLPISDEHLAAMKAFGMTASPTENLQGQRVAAVEVVLDGVNYGGGTIYLDDRDGSGWYKVTDGHGSPRIGHAELPLIDVAQRPWCPTSADASRDHAPKCINYDGPDPSVECAYPTCTNRLRKTEFGGPRHEGQPQFCSQQHRDGKPLLPPRGRAESWMDEDGVHVWVRHECIDGVQEFMLPSPPWRAVGLSPAVEPSFSCSRCGDHEFLWMDSVG